MEIELDGKKTTGTYKAVTPPQGQKSVGAKWVFTYKTDKDNLLVETTATLVAQDSGAGCRLLSNICTNSLVSVK